MFIFRLPTTNNESAASEVLARFVFSMESGNVVPRHLGERDQWQS